MKTSILCAAALVCWSVPAAANIHYTRYLVCDDEDTRMVAQRVPEGPRDELLPVPKKGAPARLDAEQLVTIDVSLAEALPTRRTDVAPDSEPEPVVMVEARNDFRCIGMPRGTAGILRVLAAPPGARFYRHPHAGSWRSDNIIPAGMLNVQRAIKPLLRILRRPARAGAEDWEIHEHARIQRDAAIALADLGAKKHAAEVIDLVRAFEKANLNIWEDALDALRIDPVRGEKYAIEVLERELASPSEHADVLVDELLPLLVTKTPATLALVKGLHDKMKGTHVTCDLAAARIRFGDQELLAHVRPHLEVDITDGLVTNCYTEIVKAAAPGEDPSEIDILTHRERWYEIVHLLIAMKGRDDPRFVKARADLTTWLHGMASSNRVASPDNVYYVPEYRALWLVALAHLGDQAAHEKLIALLTDPKDEGTAPWIAAKYALVLDIEGVPAAVKQRLHLGIKRSPRRFSSESWPHRGHLVVTETGEVIDELFRRNDPSYLLGMLQDEMFARELTAMHLARRPTKAACEVVGKAAREASGDAVNFAFWAMSVLGNKCRATMKRLASDAGEPPEVRGMATEALAMMRDKSVPRLARKKSKKELVFNAALERALIIHRSPE